MWQSQKWSIPKTNYFMGRKDRHQPGVYHWVYHMQGLLIVLVTAGSLEVKLPTMWTDEKQRWEESEKRREEKKKEDQKRESLRRKKIQVREKVSKSRNTMFFQWFVALESRKVGSLKRRVRSQLAHQRRTTFGSCDVEKVHAVVARST